MKKFIMIFLLLGACLLSYYFYDVYKDRSKAIKILKQTNLHASWDNLLSDTTSIGKVEPNEIITVFRIRYGKEYMAIKVEKKDGTIGWLLYKGDEIIFE